MINSKIASLLKTFSKDEIREFILFVNSPLHNREKVLSRITELLCKFYPDFNDENLNRKIIFSKLFNGKSYNDALMRNTISDLLRLAEDFLKLIQLGKEDFYSQYFLLKELTNRKQGKLFENNFKKAKSFLQSSDVRDEIYYQNFFLLEDEFRRNVVVNSSRILYKEDNLKDQAKNIHVQHLVENIKLYAIMLNQKLFIYDHKFDFSLFETLTQYLEKNFEKYKDIPYITIYFNCVMLYKTDEKKYFEALKIEFKKHYMRLTPTDRKNMFIVLTNYCHLQIKKGRFEFYRENFEINKEFIRTKAYFEGNDFMAHYIYNGVVQNALAINERAWSEKFINKYKKQLHPDFMESSFNLSVARLCISEENYDKALTHLSKVENIDFNFKLQIDQTLMITYFLKNETEAFFSLVDSMRHFIKRNKNLRKDESILFNNFITFIRKLYFLKIKKMGRDNKYELQLLKKQIENNNRTLSKKWLLDNLDQTIKVNS